MSYGKRDEKNTEPAGESRHRKPTRDVCSNATERTKYAGRCGDLGDQLECGLEVLIGWEPHPHILKEIEKKKVC